MSGSGEDPGEFWVFAGGWGPTRTRLVSTLGAGCVDRAVAFGAVLDFVPKPALRYTTAAWPIDSTTKLEISCTLKLSLQYVDAGQ